MGGAGDGGWLSALRSGAQRRNANATQRYARGGLSDRAGTALTLYGYPYSTVLSI